MHPILFEIPTPWGSLPVFAYGVMLGTSLVIAWFVIMYLGTRKDQLDREVMASAFIVTAGAALVGARALHVITNPQDAAHWYELSAGGLVAYGGFLGGLAGSAIYLGIKRQSLLAWADCVAPTLGLGLGLTRIGCYLSGCDFGARLGEGAPSWLVRIGTFPRDSPAYAHHLASEGLSPFADASYPVHPTQLYESLFGWVLLGLSLFIWSKRKFRGQVVLAVAVGYGLWRFFIEYMRDDPGRGEAVGFTTSQLISLAIIPVCSLLYYILWRESAQTTTAAAPAPEPAKPAKKRKRKA
jgi:phosphatidylglycerol:prolipoprotein diacylglycerol transferase